MRLRHRGTTRTVLTTICGLLLTVRRLQLPMQSWERSEKRIEAQRAAILLDPDLSRSLETGDNDGLGHAQPDLGAHQITQIAQQSMKNVAMTWHYIFGRSTARAQSYQLLSPFIHRASVEDGSSGRSEYNDVSMDTLSSSADVLRCFSWPYYTDARRERLMVV